MREFNGSNMSQKDAEAAILYKMEKNLISDLQSEIASLKEANRELLEGLTTIADNTGCGLSYKYALDLITKHTPKPCIE